VTESLGKEKAMDKGLVGRGSSTRVITTSQSHFALLAVPFRKGKQAQRSEGCILIDLGKSLCFTYPILPSPSALLCIKTGR
jgi:hypothetical protein